jgi:hypothetical protein
MEDKFGFLMKSELADYCYEQANEDLCRASSEFSCKWPRFFQAKMSTGGNHPNNNVVYKIRAPK